jgi:hypothetical protein
VKIRVGKPQARPDTSGHTKGVHEGERGPYDSQRGHLPDGRATAARSTGVNPDGHNPIDPSMPNLTPA